MGWFSDYAAAKAIDVDMSPPPQFGPPMPPEPIRWACTKCRLFHGGYSKDCDGKRSGGELATAPAERRRESR